MGNVSENENAEFAQKSTTRKIVCIKNDNAAKPEFEGTCTVTANSYSNISFGKTEKQLYEMGYRLTEGNPERVVFKLYTVTIKVNSNSGKQEYSGNGYMTKEYNDEESKEDQNVYTSDPNNLFTALGYTAQYAKVTVGGYTLDHAWLSVIAYKIKSAIGCTFVWDYKNRTFVFTNGPGKSEWEQGPKNRILAYETKYRDVDADKIRQFLTGKNSVWVDYDYIEQVIKAAKEKDYNPLLLIAVAGHEQGWVRRDLTIYSETASWDPGGGGRDKVKIMADAISNGNLILPFVLEPKQVQKSDLIWMMATNPYNVFNAWWNSVGALGTYPTLYISTLVACNTIKKFSSLAPEYSSSNDELDGKRWQRTF